MKEESLSLSDKVKSEVPRARARFIAQSIQLEESDAPGAVSIGIMTIAFLCIAIVIWAYVTPVNEVAVTTGEVVPSGHNHVVQHLEGGIVKAIYVNDGEVVEKGEVLVHISPTASKSDLQQVEARHAILKLQLIRLNSILSGVEPNFEKNKDSYKGLVESELNIYKAQLKSYLAQSDVAQTKIKQREQEYKRENSKAKYLKRELNVLQQQVEMRKDLVERGLISRAEYLDRQTNMAETETQYQQTLSNIRVTAEAKEEAYAEFNELDSKFNETIKKEIGKVSGELAELDKNLTKFQDRVDRLEITAPVAGIIKGLTVNTIQSVIKPGETIMEIVPAGEILIVETKVTTSDIGHVSIGQAAEIKINSYDPHRFGTVMGKVKQISASTFLDEQHNPYFQATIALDKDYVGSTNDKYRIIPGMTVQADIKTGEKSVLDYLLKPIYRGFQNAFQER
ncbi:MAG: HlyD family type I secretion periplasmic adaptor subunit [Gammaproteobacteria bacterium]|nr:HlyD family type I secretion periplasmic adaptor subunit [Gammaproteobacteria bacterium]